MVIDKILYVIYNIFTLDKLFEAVPNKLKNKKQETNKIDVESTIIDGYTVYIFSELCFFQQNSPFL